MVRSCCLKLATVGCVAGFVLVAPLCTLVFVLVMACVAVIDLGEALVKALWEHWEGAAVVVVLALLFAGCSAVPRGDPRDPEVFRPVNPQYPLPR
ncbi:MAG: hypothetical protein HZC55_04265 [Verrucomicrobia bacterium]|nr:hypothetical protein [Verrucomicrobiota bacterium]